MGLDNPLHILIILVVLLMLFGAKRLPELGRGMGSGIKGFKDGLMSSDADQPETTPAVSQTTAQEPAATEPPTPAERQTPV